MTTRQEDQPSRQKVADTKLPALGLIENLEKVCGPETEPSEFVRQLTAGFVSFAEAVYGSYWQVDREEGELKCVAELSPGVSGAAAAQWTTPLRELVSGVLQQAIIRYRGVAEPADPVLTGKNYVALGFPIEGEEQVAGCVTVVMERESAVLSGPGIALLRLLGEFGPLYSSSRRAARFEDFYRSLSGAWETIGEMLTFTEPRAMAQVLADRTRSSLEARRASVGFVNGEKVRVAAISGEDIIDRRSNVTRTIRAAQTEVAISGESARYVGSAPPEERSRQVSAHPQQERLARLGGADAVYSVPLWKEDELVAVFTVEFPEGRLDEELRRVIDITGGQVGPVLHLARRNSRGPIRRTRDALAAAARWVFGGEHPWRKAAAVAAVVLVAFAIFGKVDFEIAGNCRLAPSFRRVYSAPFDTTIAAAPVRPGDTVQEGQPVVEFDREELEMRLREARSKRSSVEKEMSTYLVQEEKVSQYAEARARLEALTVRVELLQRQLDQTVLRAEFPGIVISGDLSRDIGRPVHMGEELVEVAPLGSFLLEVEVAQGDVTYVEPGQQGNFVTQARPNVPIAFTVDRVRPLPEAREGDSVYVAEATIPNEEGWLRPGMGGAARVKVDRRNVTWTLARKAVNWVRLHVWW